MRVVFFSDSHLGLDMPARPRVERRRRGPDFFDNLERVLAFAADPNERVDLVLHGGDLFFRSKVPPFIVDRVYERLARFVDATQIPLGVIAGNHERSRLPTSLLLVHPLIHVFHAPSTHVFELARGGRIAVTGVPFVGDRHRFVAALTDATTSAGVHILMAHEAFEGAVVGPSDFTFRVHGRDDVVPLRALPDAFDVVLSGHIHRRQVLWRNDARADGTKLPIVYAGSIERTSFAEQSEEKAFAVLDFHDRAASERERGRMKFVALPARPMVDVDMLHDATLDEDGVRRALLAAPADAIVRITCDEAQASRLSASRVLAAFDRSMSIDLRLRGQGQGRAFDPVDVYDEVVSR